MNCRRFQNRLYEYVDGTLSPRARVAAKRHLARCDACRQAALREQQLAQFLSDRLRQGAQSLALRPEVRRRILQALERKSAPPAFGESILALWDRFAWPLGMAVSLLLIVAVLRFHPFSRVHETESARSNRRDNPSALSIQVSFRVPVCKFRRKETGLWTHCLIKPSSPAKPFGPPAKPRSARNKKKNAIMKTPTPHRPRFFVALFAITASCALAAADATEGTSGDLPFAVPFELGDAQFPPGDSITIRQVRGTSETIAVGGTYCVDGTYTLNSRDKRIWRSFPPPSSTNPTPD